MQILFITLIDIRTINANGIYSDLVREFAKKGHSVLLVSPFEKRNPCKPGLIEDNRDGSSNGTVRILKVPIGNIQKTGLVEKGISTILVEGQMLKAIRKYTRDTSFDAVIYSTPPITLVRPIRYIKKRDNATTYLLLKDIFPQNAVDMGMLSERGIKGFLYKWFRKKEIQLYRISDAIGCMSPENVKYILQHNKYIREEVVEVCPNSIEYINRPIIEKNAIRKKYNLPAKDTIFIYGGNLGRAQGVPYIVECIKEFSKLDSCYMIIAGSGTEYGVIEDCISEMKPNNISLVQSLPREEYEELVSACDVGLIFLDYRFTIPNFPSRLLSYMQNKLPVIAATDPATDIGEIIESNGFGWSCSSDNVDSFIEMVAKAERANLEEMGKKGERYLKENYLTHNSYSIINNSITRNRVGKGD